MNRKLLFRLAIFVLALCCFSIIAYSGSDDFREDSFTEFNFTRHSIADLNSYSIEAFTVGDFNNDGRLDFAVADSYASYNNLSIFYNQGASYDYQTGKTRYQFSRLNVPVSFQILSLASADIDKDGMLEIFAGTTQGRVYSFRSQSGTYIPSPVATYSDSTQSIIGIAFLDYKTNGNPDGDLDMFITSTVPSAVKFTNNGGTFTEETQDIRAVSPSSQLSCGWIVGDPFLIAGGSTGYIKWWDTSFSYDSRLNVYVGGSINSLTVCDLDNDDNLDVVSISSSTSFGYSRKKADAGLEYEPIRVLHSEFGSDRIASGDFDGDGDIDLIFSKNSEIALLENGISSIFGVYNNDYSYYEPDYYDYQITRQEKSDGSFDPYTLTVSATFNHPWYDYSVFNFSSGWNDSNFNFIKNAFSINYGICAGSWDFEVRYEGNDAGSGYPTVYTQYLSADEFGTVTACAEGLNSFTGKGLIKNNGFYITDLLSVFRPDIDLQDTEQISVKYKLNVNSNAFVDSIINSTIDYQLNEVNTVPTNKLLSDKVNNNNLAGTENVVNPTKYHFSKVFNIAKISQTIVEYVPLVFNPDFKAEGISVTNSFGSNPIDKKIVYLNKNRVLDTGQIVYVNFTSSNITGTYPGAIYALLNISTPSRKNIRLDTKWTYTNENKQKFNFYSQGIDTVHNIYNFLGINLAPRQNITLYYNFTGWVNPPGSNFINYESILNNNKESVVVNITYVNDYSDIFATGILLNETTIRQPEPGMNPVYINFTANFSNAVQFSGQLKSFDILLRKQGIPNCNVNNGEVNCSKFPQSSFTLDIMPYQNYSIIEKISILGKNPQACYDYTNEGVQYWIKEGVYDYALNVTSVAESPDLNRNNNYMLGGTLTILPSKADLFLKNNPIIDCGTQNYTYVLQIGQFGHRRLRLPFFILNQGGTEASTINAAFYNNITHSQFTNGANFQLTNIPSRLSPLTYSDTTNKATVEFTNLNRLSGFYARVDPSNAVTESVETNNYMFFSNYHWMDPAVDEFKTTTTNSQSGPSVWEFRAGQTIYLWAKISNHDYMTTDNFDVVFYVDGVEKKRQSIHLSYVDPYTGERNLDATQDIVAHPPSNWMSYSFVVPTGSEGLHTVRVAVDPESVLDDVKSNNEMTITYNVKGMAGWKSKINFEQNLWRDYYTNVEFNVTNTAISGGSRVAVYGLYAELVDSQSKFISDLGGRIFPIFVDYGGKEIKTFCEGANYPYQKRTVIGQPFCGLYTDESDTEHGGQYNCDDLFILDPQQEELRNLTFIIPKDVPAGSAIKGKIDIVRTKCDSVWQQINPAIVYPEGTCVKNGNFEQDRSGWSGWDIPFIEGTNPSFRNSPVLKSTYIINSSYGHIDGTGRLVSDPFIISSRRIDFNYTMKNWGGSVRLKVFNINQERTANGLANEGGWRKGYIDVNSEDIGNIGQFIIQDSSDYLHYGIQMDNISCQNYVIKETTTALSVPAEASYADIYMDNGAFSVMDTDGKYNQFHMCTGFCRINDIKPGESKKIAIIGSSYANFYFHYIDEQVSSQINTNAVPSMQLTITNAGATNGKIRPGYTEPVNVTIKNNDRYARDMFGIHYDLIYSGKKYTIKLNDTKRTINPSQTIKINDLIKIPRQIPSDSYLQVNAYRKYNLSPVWHESGLDIWANRPPNSTSQLPTDQRYEPSSINTYNNLSGWSYTFNRYLPIDRNANYFQYKYAPNYHRQIVWVSADTEKAEALGRTESWFSSWNGGCENIDNFYKLWVNENRIIDPFCDFLDSYAMQNGWNAIGGLRRGQPNAVTQQGGDFWYQEFGYERQDIFHGWKTEIDFYERFGSIQAANFLSAPAPVIFNEIKIPSKLRRGYDEQINFTITNSNDQPFILDFIEYNAISGSKKTNLQISGKKRNFYVPPKTTKIISDSVYIPIDFNFSSGGPITLEVKPQWLKTFDDTVFLRNQRTSNTDLPNTAIDDSHWGEDERSREDSQAFSNNFATPSKYRKWIWLDYNVARAEMKFEEMESDGFYDYNQELYALIFLNSPNSKHWMNPEGYGADNLWGHIDSDNLVAGQPNLLAIDARRTPGGGGQFRYPKLNLYYYVNKTGGEIVTEQARPFYIKFGIIQGNAYHNVGDAGINVTAGKKENITLEIKNQFQRPRLLILEMNLTDISDGKEYTLERMNVALDGLQSIKHNKEYTFDRNGFVTIDLKTYEYMPDFVWKRTFFSTDSENKDPTFDEDSSWGLVQVKPFDGTSDIESTYTRRRIWKEADMAILFENSFYLNDIMQSSSDCWGAPQCEYRDVEVSIQNFDVMECCYDTLLYSSFSDCVQDRCESDGMYWSYTPNLNKIPESIESSFSKWSSGSPWVTYVSTKANEGYNLVTENYRNTDITFLDLLFSDDLPDVKPNEVCVKVRNNGDYDENNVELVAKFSTTLGGALKTLNGQFIVNAIAGTSTNACFPWDTNQGFNVSYGKLYNFTVQIDPNRTVIEYNKNNNIKDFLTLNPVCTVSETNCEDRYDNDCDGYEDCFDSDCSGLFVCCTKDQPSGEESCFDNDDNDCDGNIDCVDSDCYLKPDNTCCLTQNDCTYKNYQGTCTGLTCNLGIHECEPYEDASLCDFTQSGDCGYPYDCAEDFMGNNWNCMYQVNDSWCPCSQKCNYDVTDGFLCTNIESTNCEYNWTTCGQYNNYDILIAPFVNCMDIDYCRNVRCNGGSSFCTNACRCHGTIITCSEINESDYSIGDSVCE